MNDSADSEEAFLLINGLAVSRTISLGNGLELRRARCAVDLDLISRLSDKGPAFELLALSLPRVSSQLRVSAIDPKALSIRAWNGLWEVLSLGAFFDCDTFCNIQSDTSADELTAESGLWVMHTHLAGFPFGKPYSLTEADATWLDQHSAAAGTLMEEPAFQSVVHSLAAYRWHPHPRARLAMIWSGIEGLFNVECELVFRMSLYVARFLEQEESARRKLFTDVKRLYKRRSEAVHGSEMKGDAAATVAESAALLRTLVRRCIELKSLPDLDTLAP